MLVDVKFTLPTKRDAEIVRSALEGGLLRTEIHENHFFDTAAPHALIQQGSLLRLRQCRTRIAGQESATETANVALKEHAHVDSGSQVVWAGQDSISPAASVELLHQPQNLYNSSILPKVSTLLQQLNLSAPLVYIGSFQNHRDEFSWPGCQSQPGLTIRLDQTSYPFGVKYELEISGINVPVQDVVDELSQVLQSLGAAFSLGTQSKFEHFTQGLLRANAQSHMVQEAKIRFQSEEDLNKLAALLANDFISEDIQENFFYDGLGGELSKKGAFFRVRVKDGGQTVVGAVKEHQEVDDGAQLCWTQEVPIAAADATLLLAKPRDLHETTKFLQQSQSTIASSLRDKFCLTGLMFVGSFRTSRAVYSWSASTSQPVGLVVKLDKTIFPFGAHFEVEVSQISVPVQDVVEELSALLTANSIEFSVSTQSKLECFVEGCQKNFMNAHNVVVR